MSMSWSSSKNRPPLLAATVGIALTLVLSACSSARRSTPDVTPAAPVAAPTPTRDPNIVFLDFDAAPHRYRVESSTYLYSPTDSTTPIDSVRSTAVVVLTISNPPGDSMLFQGRVENLEVRSTDTTNAGLSRLENPYSLSWQVTNNRIGGAPRDGDSCDQLEDVAHDLLTSILPVLPDSLVTAGSWRSNSELRSCRAGLMFTLTSEVQLTSGDFEELRQSRMLHVSGTSTLRLAGQGKQGASEVALRGNGRGSTTHVIDLRVGVLESSTSTSSMLLEFDLGYRTDRVIQKTTRSVTRIN